MSTDPCDNILIRVHGSSYSRMLRRAMHRCASNVWLRSTHLPATECHQPNNVICIVCSAHAYKNQQIHFNKLASINNIYRCPVVWCSALSSAAHISRSPHASTTHLCHTSQRACDTNENCNAKKSTPNVIIVYIDDTVPIYSPIPTHTHTRARAYVYTSPRAQR